MQSAFKNKSGLHLITEGYSMLMPLTSELNETHMENEYSKIKSTVPYFSV